MSSVYSPIMLLAELYTRKHFPLNVIEVELSDNQTIILTHFDANHCPVAVMYFLYLRMCETPGAFESFLSGFSLRALNALYSILETSMPSPGFSIIFSESSINQLTFLSITCPYFYL